MDGTTGTDGIDCTTEPLWIDGSTGAFWIDCTTGTLLFFAIDGATGTVTSMSKLELSGTFRIDGTIGFFCILAPLERLE